MQNVVRELNDLAQFRLTCSEKCAKKCQGFPHLSNSELDVLNMTGCISAEADCQHLVKVCGATEPLIPAINSFLVFYRDKELRKSVRRFRHATRESLSI